MHANKLPILDRHQPRNIWLTHRKLICYEILAVYVALMVKFDNVESAYK